MARTKPEGPGFDFNEIASPRFNTARRGYDTEEVDAFLSRMARKTLHLDAELRRSKARRDLLEQKVASAQEAAYARVFRQVIEVLRTAEREAGRIRAEAQRDAEAMLAQAREQAALVQLAPRGANAGRRKAGAPAGRVSDHDDLSVDVELLWGRSET